MGATDRLTLMEKPRPVHDIIAVTGTARRVPRLSAAVSQWEPVVNGRRVRDLVGVSAWSGHDLVSVLDAAFPGRGIDSVLTLLDPGRRDEEWSSLDPGRAPVAICRLCGGLECGAVTVGVDLTGAGGGSPSVRWHDLRLEDGYTPAAEMPDLSGVGPFRFDAAAYAAALTGVGDRLPALAGQDARDEAAWAGRHPVRAWFGRRFG